MRFKVSAFISIALLLFIVGCSGSRAKDQTLKIRVEGNFVEVYLSGEKEKPRNPLLRKSDFQELDHLARDYYSFVMKSDRKAAVNLFLPEVRRTEDSMIPKDLELAKESPESYMPASSSYIWYQDSKLWPRKEAVLLKNDEVKRLVILSNAYEKAVIIRTTFKKGNTRKLLAIKNKGKYFLLPL
ncbi:MAG: hypothetical protein K6T91_09770 [Firmicutes bacterium]|nr:hypothetical protein [Bacillota bacterium]